MTKTLAEFLSLPERFEGMCFGCGPQNEVGLKMRFFSNGTLVAAELSVPPHLCGWGNVVHGGIITTILDEVMGWTGIWLLRRLVLTKNISVEFLKPVITGEDLRVEGSVLEHRNERLAVMKGELYNREGNVCARATGAFGLFTKEAARKLGFLDLSIIDGFAEKFLA
jgi:uncharacterized protein (TIGR00369 family)